jgi:hypothetical protein
MRILVLALGLLLVPLAPLSAQLLVEVTMAQNYYLPGEAMPATVRITNRSGRTLQLGTDAEWLTFTVEERDGAIVRKIGEVPVLGEFILKTAQVASKKVDLAPYFALTQPGSYHVIATVRIQDWDSLASSPPKKFGVIEGTKLWTQEFGVPASSGLNQPPELRRYSLLQANYLRSELRLYFRLTDAADSRVLKVFTLGEIVSFGRPEMEVDGESRLHVLHQNSARTSRYTIISPDGEVVLRQLYEYGPTRPRLAGGPDGKLGIIGPGTVRRPDKHDVPPPKPKE